MHRNKLLSKFSTLPDSRWVIRLLAALVILQARRVPASAAGKSRVIRRESRKRRCGSKKIRKKA